MAKTVITQVTDDLDGSGGADTISFAYRGTTYEIDLGRKNASAFDKLMKPYVDAGRKVTAARGGRRASSNGRRGAGSRSASQLATIREWARLRVSTLQTGVVSRQASWMSTTPLTNPGIHFSRVPS
jgi:hypothetical protein